MPIFFFADIKFLDNIGKNNNYKHCRTSKNNEIFGYCCVFYRGVIILGITKEKRFNTQRIRHTEQYHKNAYFIKNTITHPSEIFIIIHKQPSQKNHVKRLVDHKCQPTDYYRK